MKNYISGFLALVIACCLFSFTQPPAKSTGTQALYWFEFNDGVVGPQIGNGAMTKEEAISETCPDEPGEPCARGYLSTQNPGSSTNLHQEQIEKELE